jgi:hypothetical protein
MKKPVIIDLSRLDRKTLVKLAQTIFEMGPTEAEEMAAIMRGEMKNDIVIENESGSEGHAIQIGSPETVHVAETS